MEEKVVSSSQYYCQDVLYANDRQDSEDSEVTKFYEGLNILITGGSGYIGKLLIEKLLRSCPNLGKLYLAIRAKKGKTPEERFKEHFEDVIYDRLKRENPDFSKHVMMIEADTGLGNLGLSAIDREKLIENVNVIFHGAAIVNFTMSLRQIVSVNVRGTKLILELAKEMKNLKSFVHISTAFSHCPLKQIDEKFYESPMEPDKLLALIDMLDDDLLSHMTPKIIGEWPNTYAFSKALGEEIVRKYSAGVPTCVVRPSIVIATYKEPVSGWINNIYGATGVVVGAAIGLLHTLHCEITKIADIIPADYVINNIIVAGWDTAKEWNEEINIKLEKSENLEKSEDHPIIYNSVSSCQKPINWGEFMEMNEKHGDAIPTAKAFWHYSLILNRHLWLHNLCVYLFHMVPGTIVDVLSILSGRQPLLLDTYRKINKFSHVISYFCTQEWKFNNDNTLALWEKTSLADKEKFNFNLSNLDWDDYFYHEVRGLRMYIANDPLDTIDVGRKKKKIFKTAHYTLVTASCLFMVWIAYIFIRFIFSVGSLYFN